MKMKPIFTEKAPTPGGWYSQAYQVGDLIYTAGTTGIDPSTGQLIVPNEIGAQTEQALKNIQEILKSAGASLKDVFKTTVFISDINDFQKFNEVYKKFFPENPPARSTIQIGKFAGGVCVEIEVIALKSCLLDIQTELR